MKKLRKIIRQEVATLPRQSIAAMKVAFGVRAQYATIMALAVLMATQIAGVAIFSGRAAAALPSLSLELETREVSDVNVSYQNSANLKFNLHTNDLHNLKGAAYSFEYGSTTSYGEEANVESTQVVRDSEMSFSGGPTYQYGGYGQTKDHQGNIYKIYNGNLYKYNSAGQYLLQVTATPNHFQGSSRADLVFDSQDNLYVGGFGGVIEKYSPSGNLLNTIGSATYIQIATDPDDNLYVVEQRTVSGSLVHKYDAAGALVDEFVMPIGTAVLCGGDLAIDSAGSLYVSISDCDSQTSDSIQKLSSDGNLTDTWAIPVAGTLYIDDSNIIYVRGQATLTTEGDPIPSPATLPLTSYMLGYNVLLDVDTEHGLAHMMNRDENVVITYARTASVEVGNLQCGETYHYRAKAVAGSETVYGEDQETIVPCNPLNILTGWIPDGPLGEAYEAQIQTNASGGTTTFSIVDGQLPPGLDLDSSSGAITGTAIEAGSFEFTIRAENDGANTPGIDEQTLSMYVTGQNLDVVDSNNSMYVGDAYTNQVQTTGGLGGEIQFGKDPSSNDDFPPGITMSSTGAITGTPTQAGSYAVLVRVTQGPLTGVGYVQFQVENPTYNEISISGGGLNGARVGRAYSEDMGYYTGNGFGPKTYAITAGELTPGLELNPLTGIISGTPVTAGTYEFTLEVTDITGSASGEFTMPVAPTVVQGTNTPIVTITSPADSTQFDADHDSVVVTGTGPAGQSIVVSMDGYELGTASVNDGGTWSYTVDDIFPGDHSFEAKYVPVGDLAVLGSLVDGDMTAENGKVTIIDMGTGKRIQSISLPPYSFVYVSAINEAGTKAYVAGGRLNLDEVGDGAVSTPFLYEIDLGTGMLGRTLDMSSIGPDHTVSALTLINDHTAYIEYGRSYLESAITSVNLDTMTLGSSVGLPLSNDYTVSNNPRGRNISLVEANGRIYSSLSTQDDDDLQTATVINRSDNSMHSITILNDPLWYNCATEVIKSGNDVYYVANDKIVKMNTTNGTVASTITMGSTLQSTQMCVRSLQIDAAHNKAYVLANGVLFTVDLSSGATTKVQDQVGSLYINAWVDTYIDWMKQLQPNQEITDELRQMFFDQLSNSLPTSLPYQQSNLMSLNSDASMLHIFWMTGIISNFNTVTSQYVQSTQSYYGYAGYSIQSGAQRLVAPATVSPSASVSFSVEEGEIVEPGCVDDSCEPVDPDCLESCEPEEPGEPELPGAIVPQLTPKPVVATTPIKGSPAVVAVQNSLLALVARIPEPLAVGLPWLLLSLALILVSSQYYQVLAESAGTKKMQDRVDHQRRLVEEQNNFVALSTHYLHTPLTVMEGEISLMVKAGTLTQAQATKLRATLTSLAAEAEAVLAREEQNKVE